MPDSPDTCGQNPHPETKRCGFKNIRIRVDGALVSFPILRRFSSGIVGFSGPSQKLRNRGRG